MSSFEVNWKERYDELANLTQELLSKYNEMQFLVCRIRSHLGDSDQLSLRERNKMRYMKLTEAVTLTVRYERNPYQGRELTFPAGTMISCGKDGQVYLDEYGDGFLDFPSDKLVEVEVDMDDPNINWDNVVHQG